MSVFGSKSTNVYSCAGFSDACITKPSTRSDDRRQRSARVIETANLCDVSHETIRRIEVDDTTLKEKTIAKVRAAFETAGVQFIEENGGGPGVRLKQRTKSVEEISKQIDVLEETISSIPTPTAPSPEAAMGTMIKAVAENKVANLKARRKRIRHGPSK